MPVSDRVFAERADAVVAAHAPERASKLWYGMSAYALGGQIVCLFQSAEKSRSRYATLGSGDKTALDDGSVWPAGFAGTEKVAEDEGRIAALLRRAVG